MLKFCLQGNGLKGKRVATLTEIKNRNVTTVGTVTSSRMVWGWHDTSSQLSSCEWCRIIVSGQAGSVAAVSEQATPSL